jgi:copper oxidase (laccase) domain-containing protein
VRAACTTRTGGCSGGPWTSLNLGGHCGDAPDNVRRNRERLLQHLPAPPQWLRQVHGATVARHPGVPGAAPEADALVAFGRGQVCAVLTADCLPVFFCDRAGSRVAGRTPAGGSWRAASRRRASARHGPRRLARVARAAIDRRCTRWAKKWLALREQ